MKIVCLGDSLTFGYEVPRKDNWVSLAGAAGEDEFINRGVNGDSTGGMLARFHPEVLELAPAAVIIMGGCNDIMTSGTDKGARANLAALAHQAAGRAILPIVAAPPPFDVAHVREDWVRLTDFHRALHCLVAYVDWLRMFASVFNITLIDFYRLFLPEPSRGLDPDLYIDGLHPSPQGHKLMAAEVLRVLAARAPDANHNSQL